MLKAILCFSVCLYAMVLPSDAALTDQDLDKIRLIIHEANAPIKAEIVSVKDELSAKIVSVKDELSTKIVSVKDELSKDITSTRGEVSWVRGKFEGLDKQMTWIMVLIGAVIGIPQIIMIWRSKKDRAQEREIQVLREEIEVLKQQRIVNP